MTAPLEAIETRIASGDHEYVELQLASDEVLKGTVDPVFKIRWYTRQEDYSPSIADIRRLNGKKVLVFLVRVDDGHPINGIYFAGYTPAALADADRDFVSRVRDEVATQRKLLAEFSSRFSPASEPLFGKIKALVDALTVENTESEAFEKLMQLGPEAAPALIMLMDDRRDLPRQHISLKAPPGNFESIIHYGPKKVVDALGIVLPGLTHRNFVSTHNGGTEEQRQAAVDGWRIYLSKVRLAAATNSTKGERQ